MADDKYTRAAKKAVVEGAKALRDMGTIVYDTATTKNKLKGVGRQRKKTSAVEAAKKFMDY
jgi:hypothetical protein